MLCRYLQETTSLQPRRLCLARLNLGTIPFKTRPLCLDRSILGKVLQKPASLQSLRLRFACVGLETIPCKTRPLRLDRSILGKVLLLPLVSPTQS